MVAGRLAGLERLIAGTSHEINNPLTSVQGLASLLLMDAKDTQTREDSEVIAAETERAVVVIRNLRSFVQRGGQSRSPAISTRRCAWSPPLAGTSCGPVVSSLCSNFPVVFPR